MPAAPAADAAAAADSAAASEPQWSRDSRSIYFLQGGGIYTLAVAAAPGDGYRGGSGRGRTRRPRRSRRRHCRGARHGNGVRRRGAAAHPLLREDGDRYHRRTPPGLRRGLARDEESFLRSQDARRELGRGQGQVRGHAAPHRRHRGTAQPDHGDDRRYERLPHRHHRRHAACPRRDRPRSASPRAIPASTWSPMPAASTRSATSTARVRPITITSRSRPATSSSR